MCVFWPTLRCILTQVYRQYTVLNTEPSRRTKMHCTHDGQPEKCVRYTPTRSLTQTMIVDSYFNNFIYHRLDLPNNNRLSQRNLSFSPMNEIGLHSLTGISSPSRVSHFHCTIYFDWPLKLPRKEFSYDRSIHFI